MQDCRADVTRFVDFAIQRLERQEPCASPEQLLEDWRAEQELREATADIESAITNFDAGRCIPLEVAFDDLRRRLAAL